MAPPFLGKEDSRCRGRNGSNLRKNYYGGKARLKGDAIRVCRQQVPLAASALRARPAHPTNLRTSPHTPLCFAAAARSQPQSPSSSLARMAPPTRIVAATFFAMVAIHFALILGLVLLGIRECHAQQTPPRVQTATSGWVNGSIVTDQSSMPGTTPVSAFEAIPIDMGGGPPLEVSVYTPSASSDGEGAAASLPVWIHPGTTLSASAEIAGSGVVSDCAQPIPFVCLFRPLTTPTRPVVLSNTKRS